MRRGGLPFALVLLVLLAAGCREATPGSSRAEAAAPAGPGSQAAMVQRSLPAVVLVVAQLPNDGVRYGSGLLVGVQEVITNHHVVADALELQVMLHREGRLSYTPMDGGLARYLFENQRDLVSADVLRVDESMDLALLRVKADTRSLPRLVFAESPPSPGQPVFALGHPGETVWSFTAGVVSTLHRGAIQHDAAINGGSSGGPLLNEKGEVVGINTAKLLAGIEGVSFARPVAVVRRLLVEGGEADPGVDFAVLEAAVLGCFHAQEVGSPGLEQCFDPEGWWSGFRGAVEQVLETYGIPEEIRRTLRARMFTDAFRDEVFAEDKKLGALRHEGASEAELEAALAAVHCRIAAQMPEVRERVDPSVARRNAAREERFIEQIERHWNRVRVEVMGFQPDLKDQTPLRQTLRMGIRIEEVRWRSDDEAWVLLAGRNLDRSPYRLTELWKRRDGRWYQRLSPPADDLASLPEGWPPPLGDHDGVEAGLRRHFHEALAATCDPRTAGTPASAAPPG